MVRDDEKVIKLKRKLQIKCATVQLQARHQHHRTHRKTHQGEIITL